MDVSSPKRVPIDRIVLDKRFQVRAGLDGGHLKRCIASLRVGKAMDPVVVATVDGVLVCLDGWHRIEAHRRIKRTWIEAVDRGPMSSQQAGWEAAKANLSHGLPIRKRVERRAVFEQYVNANQHRCADGKLKSARAMAADLCGMVSDPTVPVWMEKLFPEVHEEMRSGPANGKGGLPTGNSFSSDEVHLDRFRAALGEALEHMQRISDPEGRGEAMACLGDFQAGAKEFEAAGPIKPYDPWA